MEQKVVAYIKKHKLLERNTTVLVGVSGGPDSMALLSLLHSIRGDWGLKLVALSVDHGLRGKASLDDVAYVQHICKQWGIIFEGTSVDVASYKEMYQKGTQVAARELRYQFFKEQMEAYDADYLALGHHADDQLETMIMNLARSGNPNALSGIPVKRPFATGLIIRPLLCVTKDDLESFCKSRKIIPRIDVSNEDTTYTRNAVRKYVAPYMKELNPNVHRSLQHMSMSMQADNAYLEKLTREMVDRIVTFTSGEKKASFETKSFGSFADALQRRAFHLILNHLYNEIPKSLSYMHEENFLQLVHSDAGNKEMDLPGPLKVVKAYQNVLFMESEPVSINVPYNITVNIPGETTLPDGSKLIASESSDPSNKGKYTYSCSYNEVILPLRVRTRRAGDRMAWKGLNGHKKVKDIFIDHKVPLYMRNDWPIVEDAAGRILWIVGLKKSVYNSHESVQPSIQLTYEK